MATSRLERIGTIFSRAEGLLLRGAMKPDDRPLWFDIYRAFPPTTEPKFARPKPENKPIRQILYREDVLRAKFHAKGHGLSSNMLSLSETHTKRLILKYEELKTKSIPDEELIEKCVEAVGSERQIEATKSTTKNPDSVSSNVLAEANLKTIFKE
ncbi:28S ribosomal protein S23, mitochondrial [Nymphalis io]|uniref:28S ribosomal protein S23, mitochondrial n=1 Tax=Inachis io TaxID=171585 RepID=UPI0021697512|nr:28S ribosomal protein S23, mitochondrial [Nymphalis io]